jgi:hypothetical protein
VAGLLAAMAIYATADDADASALYEMQISKQYVRQLQRFGGKASVVFDEFNRWFAGLWQGKTLAFTVAWIAVAAAGGVFLFARYVADDERD